MKVTVPVGVPPPPMGAGVAVKVRVWPGLGLAGATVSDVAVDVHGEGRLTRRTLPPTEKTRLPSGAIATTTGLIGVTFAGKPSGLVFAGKPPPATLADRKSTRLNSSHLG